MALSESLHYNSSFTKHSAKVIFTILNCMFLTLGYVNLNQFTNCYHVTENSSYLGHTKLVYV